MNERIENECWRCWHDLPKAIVICGRQRMNSNDKICAWPEYTYVRAQQLSGTLVPGRHLLPGIRESLNSHMFAEYCSLEIVVTPRSW